jgi:hypothetical protein
VIWSTRSAFECTRRRRRKSRREPLSFKESATDALPEHAFQALYLTCEKMAPSHPAEAAANPAAPRQRLQHNTSLTLGALLTLILKNGQLTG